MNLGLSRIFKVSYYATLVYFTYLMILITIQYLPPRLDVAFLNVKQDVVNLLHYQFAFFAHVYSSIFVLISGITQFSKTIRSTFPAVHRLLGKLYVCLVLLVASPSGLIMAIYANGGALSRVSFSLQAILWAIFTFISFRYASKRDWFNHRKFMIRSYALTLSAISLRLFKWLIVSTFSLPPMDTYKIVSWLGWLVNIALVEVYLIYEAKTKKSFL